MTGLLMTGLFEPEYKLTGCVAVERWIHGASGDAPRANADVIGVKPDIGTTSDASLAAANGEEWFVAAAATGDELAAPATGDGADVRIAVGAGAARN